MEHAGGTPNVGRDTNGHDSSDDPNGSGYHRVDSLVDFDFAIIDSIPDRLKECARLGDFSVIGESIKSLSDERASEAIKRVLALIIHSKKPGLTAHQLAWGCGLIIDDGDRLNVLAKRYGASKQAFHKGARLAMQGLEIKQQIRPRRVTQTKVNFSFLLRAKHGPRMSFVAWAMQGARWINCRINEAPISTWPASRREWLKRALKPIADFYSKL